MKAPRTGVMAPLLEEALVHGRGRACVLAPELRHDAATRCPLDQAELEEVRLVDVLDRVLLLPESHRQGREPYGPTIELVHDRAEEIPVDPLEPLVVDLEKRQRLAGDVDR